MNFNRLLSISSLWLLVFYASCSDYQKLLNSDDTNEKYRMSEEYYKNGEYRKANRLLEQIVPKYRGKPQAERVIFFFADSYFQTKSYLLAAYQYESFVKSYPKSERIVEAYFKAAKSHYYLSPSYSLDQEETVTAIEKLQIFINNFPTSEYIDEANQLIEELQVKLEQKDFEIAKQYFTIRDYQAAIKSLDNFTSSFPGTKFREEALFVKFNASFEIAYNSIDAKKKERMEDLKQQYTTILRYFPETIFLSDLDNKMRVVEKELEKQNTTTTSLTNTK
ncbi:MAG: outer membrane protein assembly factor BamD [Flavobacteriaceae bacterium]|nr:outer membrane protein assembly factor BamD [Flavobacteriaceae bacterium]